MKTLKFFSEKLISSRLSKMILTSLVFLTLSCVKDPFDTNSGATPESDAVNVICEDSQNTLQEIIDDMSKPHEGKAHGVPIGYDWYSQPVLHNLLPPQSYFYMTNWGQFYEDAAGNEANNTRVEMRNLYTFYLSKTDGQWHQLQIGERIDGALYNELQQPESKKASDKMPEGQGISATAGGGYCFHFWSNARGRITPSDVQGIFTTCEARLIVSNSSLPDDRMNARYLLNVGADYWQNEDSGSNASIGIGRFKYVKTGWRSYNFTTLSENSIRKTPSPF